MKVGVFVVESSTQETGESSGLTKMSFLQALRRSMKGGDKEKAQHISITPKSAIAIVPPKKVRQHVSVNGSM